MKRSCPVASVLLVAVMAAGCASPGTQPQTVTVQATPTAITTVVSTVAPVVTTPEPAAVLATAAPVTVTTEPAAEAASAIMPDVTCKNLQVAQDTIQAAGVFFSRSSDATGQGRSQLIDSNWTVVSQTPAAGSPVGEAEAVLAAVKIGESGDCS
jgi:beta-lactam-binding protein with PASTA domain